MANPNRTVANWRNRKVTHILVERIPVNTWLEGEKKKDELKATGKYSRVKVSTRKIGPRNNPTIITEVLVYEGAE